VIDSNKTLDQDLKSIVEERVDTVIAESSWYDSASKNLLSGKNILTIENNLLIESHNNNQFINKSDQRQELHQ